jgi:hypothetical protein
MKTLILLPLDIAGFQEIGQIGKRMAFELDTMTSDARLARQYRVMLNKKPESKTASC